MGSIRKRNGTWVVDAYVGRALELADLVEVELARREPFEFEPLTMSPWETSRVH